MPSSLKMSATFLRLAPSAYKLQMRLTTFASIEHHLIGCVLLPWTHEPPLWNPLWALVPNGTTLQLVKRIVAK